jgi:hypothetical protein
MSLLFLTIFYQLNVAKAESSPSWAEPGVELIYGSALWEYFPTANVNSTIASMEQQFNIGIGNYTPNGYWDSGLYKFSLVSADDEQGVFQVQGGTLSLLGYEWDSATAIWNYIWENQTWIANGTQLMFGLTIYAPPAQLSGNPLTTVGNYQAYKVSEFTSTNQTIYKYYEKDTGRLLYMVSFSTEGSMTDFSVMGLSATSLQVVSFQGYGLSVMSNSTISALLYNSTANALSFSASGPTGTMGYSEIAMPKELCANISTTKVYVDGVETEFTYTALDVYWIITVIYQHSTHDIQVVIPEFTSFALITCVSIAIAAFASSLLKTRPKISRVYALTPSALSLYAR